MTQHLETSRRRCRRHALASACIVWSLSASLPLAAQSTPSSPDDDTVQLNPFVVNTARDVGYSAASTLGGTRTNTELKDLANPLDVFTPELMQDLGIQDIQDLTNFASSVEPNAAGELNADGQEREVWNYNYMQVRGFKIGRVTRNFMDLNAQFEAYNSERVEFSKGPNAILAGIGDPGGSVNFTSKTPLLHANRHSMSHRTDDLGSQRATLDFNQVLIKDTLGLRLNAMWEDEEFYRHPAYEKQHAWHLTGQWRPTTKTIVNLGYEQRRSDRASPRGIFARDRVTAWLDAGSPIVTAVPSNNNVIVQGSTTAQPASSLGMATVNGANWIIDSDGVIRNTQRTARGNTISVNGQNMDTAASALDFPLDVWVGGANGINDSDWDITELSVSHSVTDDFSLELSYGRSDNHVRQGNSVSRELYVDTNNFGVNTHAGEMYVETRPFWIDRQFDIEHYRGTAAYQLDLRDAHRWLGRHQVAAVYEFNQRKEWQNNGRLSLTQRPDGAVPATSIIPFSIRTYLDPEAGVIAGADMRDLYYSEGINQDGYVAEFLPTESWAYYRWLVEQETVLGVLQSRWFDDRLVTTIGVRKDDLTRWVASKDTLAERRAQHPSTLSLDDRPRVDTGIARNYGAVFHATNWLSFTANYATNVAPGAESRGFSGDYLPQSSGQSVDYGVRLSLLQNRFNISLVRFETSQEKAPTQNTSVNSPIDALQAIATILFENGITPTDRLANSGDWTVSDRDAEGEELTITANPTRNWTLRLAGSRFANVLTNIAPEIRSYYDANLAFYEQQDPNLVRAGDPDSLGVELNRAKNASALMATRENTKSFPSSEYNVRFTTKYTFNEGPSVLKGLFVGGSARWSSAPVIGYYRRVNEAGSIYYDPTLAAKGDDPIYTDLFFGYKWRLRDKLTWKIQVNVSNLFDNDDPVPFRAVNSAEADNFEWVSYGYRPVDGRVISLTNTISF